MADWIYEVHKPLIDANWTYVNKKGETRPVGCTSNFADALGQRYPEFEIVREMANAAKHMRLKERTRQQPDDTPTHAANTYVYSGAFSSDFSDDFDTDRVKLEGPTDRDFSGLATAVKAMWDALFVSEGWGIHEPPPSAS